LLRHVFDLGRSKACDSVKTNVADSLRETRDVVIRAVSVRTRGIRFRHWLRHHFTHRGFAADVGRIASSADIVGYQRRLCTGFYAGLCRPPNPPNLAGYPECEFRFNPATDSDLKPAGVPI
jgi:hypothetical protein